MTAREDKDANDGNESPEVSVLRNRLDVWPGNDGKGGTSGDYREADNPSHPIDRSLDRRVRALGKVTGDPGMDLLSDLGPKTLSACAFFQHDSDMRRTRS